MRRDLKIGKKVAPVLSGYKKMPVAVIFNVRSRAQEQYRDRGEEAHEQQKQSGSAQEKRLRHQKGLQYNRTPAFNHAAEKRTRCYTHKLVSEFRPTVDPIDQGKGSGPSG